MNRHRQTTSRMVRYALPGLVLALLLAACGRAAQPSQAPSTSAALTTPTPRAAAATSPAPTAIVGPSTTAVASPTVSVAATELQMAFTRAADLGSYRVAFTYGAVVADGAPLMDYTAAFNGADVAFRFTMPAEGAPSGQPETLAVITTGGVTYARGPLPLTGAEQAVWYTLGTSPPSATTPPFTAARLAALLSERIDLAQLKSDGAEPIDGQPCTRYRGGLDVALGMLDSFGRPTTPEAVAAEATPVVPRMEAQGYTFGESEALVWVCGEGALRRVRASVQGTTPGAQAAPFILRATLELTDASGPVSITAPVEPVTPGTVVPVAIVFNGGNVRARPDLQGEVQDQIHAQEPVRLLAKTGDASWYRIVDQRDVVGWVSASLLTVAPADAATVPVVSP